MSDERGQTATGDGRRLDLWGAASGTGAAWPPWDFEALHGNPLLFSCLLDGEGLVLGANLPLQPREAVQEQPLDRPFWARAWWCGRPELSARVRACCERALASGEAFRTVTAYVGVDGSERIMDLTLSPVRHDHVSAARLVVTGADITDAIAAQDERERQLAHALQLSTKVLDHVADGIYELDTQGLVDFVNPAAARITGYPREAQIGRDHHALMHGRRADGSPYPAAECPVRRALHTGRTVSSGQEVFWRADGSPVAVELVAAPTFEDGVVTGVVVSFRDLSERRKNEQLEAALTSRTVIDQAIGIIMAQNRCGPEDAFDTLRTASQNRNVKLRDLATRIVTAVSRQPASNGHPFEG